MPKLIFGLKWFFINEPEYSRKVCSKRRVPVAMETEKTTRGGVLSRKASWRRVLSLGPGAQFLMVPWHLEKKLVEKRMSKSPRRESWGLGMRRQLECWSL